MNYSIVFIYSKLKFFFALGTFQRSLVIPKHSDFPFRDGDCTNVISNDVYR